MTKCTLTATTIYAKPAKVGRVKVLTIGLIKFGPLLLGSVKLTGRYSPEQVLAEARRNPGAVTKTKDGVETLPVVLGAV